MRRAVAALLFAAILGLSGGAFLGGQEAKTAAQVAVRLDGGAGGASDPTPDVDLQAASPGTAQTGNINISGTALLGVAADVASGGAYKYNGVNLARAQTALENFYFGNSGNLTGTGIQNFGFGPDALSAIAGGSYNVAIGASALYNTLGGSSNVAVGPAALIANTGGLNNVAIGFLAGYNAGVPLQTNANCTFVGNEANSSADGLTNAIAIGSAAQVGLSNVAVIGSTALLGVQTTSGLFATRAAAPTIASAGTIAPTKAITFISGTTTIETITPPSPISLGGGQITLIPTGVFLTGVTGNIALASTSVVSKALIMTYDVTTAKWYPSY